MAFFSKLRESLSKTKNSINDKIENVMKTFSSVDDDLFDELEEALITADLGVNTSMDIIEKLRDAAAEKHIKNSVDLKAELAAILEGILTEGSSSKLDIRGLPAVIMVIGVNGVGKTTSIGKLAAMYKKQGKNVVIAAADTFRAAAIEQLEIWAERADVRIIKQQEGSDPAAVIYDAINACKGNTLMSCCATPPADFTTRKILCKNLKRFIRYSTANFR